MDSLRRETFGLLRSRAGPIGLEVCSAEEEQCGKVSNHPRGDDSNHRPVHKAKVASNAWRKDTSVEVKEAQFDATYDYICYGGRITASAPRG